MTSVRIFEKFYTFFMLFVIYLQKMTLHHDIFIDCILGGDQIEHIGSDSCFSTSCCIYFTKCASRVWNDGRSVYWCFIRGSFHR